MSKDRQDPFNLEQFKQMLARTGTPTMMRRQLSRAIVLIGDRPTYDAGYDGTILRKDGVATLAVFQLTDELWIEFYIDDGLQTIAMNVRRQTVDEMIRSLQKACAGWVVVCTHLASLHSIVLDHNNYVPHLEEDPCPTSESLSNESPSS